MKKGYQILHKKWPELYFITHEENKIHDSSGNLYMKDFEDYLVKNSDVQDNAGHIWEFYEEVEFENL